MAKGRKVEFQADLEPVTAHVAADYHNTHGGSSFFVHGGDYATSGYAVGGSGIPETTIHRPTLTPDEYQSHRDRVRAGTKDPGAVVGTWVENGKSVLDASTVVQSRQFAKSLQKKRGERAVFNLNTGREEDLS
jgi:hypothetical protein